MALAIAAIALEFSNSVPLAASPAAVPPARGVARPARHSSSSGVESMGRKIINDFKHDTKARRQRRRDRKSTCAQCGNRAGEGVKLLACSRCKAANYCSASCQKAHYHDGGHKERCLNFANPPFAKRFDASEREDVPWPIDPVFSAAHAAGVGMWVTTDAGLGIDLQQANAIPNTSGLPHPEGAPSFQRWVHGPGPGRRLLDCDTSKYIGTTLFCLRAVVHNRRTDGRAVVLALDAQALLVDTVLAECMLPEQRAQIARESGGLDQVDGLVVRPWKDYNNMSRFAILEINGHTMPEGSYGLNGMGEYQPPPAPTGAPWDRVLSWRTGRLVLGAGDYAVVTFQYKLGDGTPSSNYPEVLTRTVGTQLYAVLLDTKSTEPDWVHKARRELQSPPTFQSSPLERVVAAALPWDWKFVNEYYKPYFDGGSEAFSAQRLGARAKHIGDVMMRQGPVLLKRLLDMVLDIPDEEREDVQRRLADVGLTPDLLRRATIPRVRAPRG